MTEQAITPIRHPVSRIRDLPCFMVSLMAFLAGACIPRSEDLPPAPCYPITIGSRTLSIPVALDKVHCRRGLMYRRQLGPDEGMLFVFPREGSLWFWMKNTHVPLSVAFIRADGTITQIEDMAPLDLTRHRPRASAQYALEMPQGWFGRNHVKEGDMVKIPKEAAKRAAY